MTAVFKTTPAVYHDGGITYRLATAEELPQILQLRTLCYGEAGKHADDATFTDRYDEAACHLTAFLRTKPIGSMRILFNDQAEEWEHDRFFEWPTSFPDRSKVAEITRVCIRKEFRRANVLLNLFKQGALTLLRGG